MASPMSEIFTSFQKYLNTEQELREVSGYYCKVMFDVLMSKVHEVPTQFICPSFIQEIRNIVKDIEQTAREVLTTLQKIHHEGGIQESKLSIK
jgi:hypothetical protein